MFTNHRMGRKIVGMLVSLALVAGCNSVPDYGIAQHSKIGREKTDSRLNSKQTADIQVTLGRSLEQQGEIEKAMAAYRDAVTRDAHRADALLRLAVLHDKQGKFKESAKLYCKALEADPGNPDIFCDRGYSLYLQHQWADAEMNLQQAIALKPDHRRAHNNLGLVLAHTNRLDSALAEFQRVGCTQAEALANAAFCLTIDGRLEEARNQYRLALAADPASPAAKAGLRQLETTLVKTGRPIPTPSSETDETVYLVGSYETESDGFERPSLKPQPPSDPTGAPERTRTPSSDPIGRPLILSDGDGSVLRLQPPPESGSGE